MRVSEEKACWKYSRWFVMPYGNPKSSMGHYFLSYLHKVHGLNPFEATFLFSRLNL